MKTLRKALLPCIFATTLVSGGAQASLLVDNWTLNLDPVTGQSLTGSVTNISEITYLGISKALNFDSDSTAGLSIGDTSAVFGALAATGFTKVDGTTGNGFPIGGGLNGGYEMTFTFQTDGEVTGITLDGGGNVIGNAFTHNAPDVTTGILNIYIDNLLDGAGNGVQASTVSGTGYDDGTLVASFLVLAGGGGSFNFLTFDGSDDATFVLMSALTGVFTDEFGVDLATKIGELLVVTDSNFDADPLNNNSFSQAAPTNTSVFGGGCATPGQGCFWAREDGSASLFLAVPEPGSLLLIGGGLLGIWGMRRKVEKA